MITKIKNDHNYTWIKNDGSKLNIESKNIVNLLDEKVILNHKLRKELDFSTTMYLAINIALHHKSIIRRSNSAVVAAYKAIEVGKKNNIILVRDIIDHLCGKLNLLEDFDLKEMKDRSCHVLMSLVFARLHLNLSLCDEEKFSNDINFILNFSRGLLTKPSALTSLYSILSTFCIACIYTGKLPSKLLYNEVFKLTQYVFSNYTPSNSSASIQEFSIMINRLSMLKKFTMGNNNSYDIIFDSLRLSKQKKEVLISNFFTFNFNNKIQLEPSSLPVGLNKEEIKKLLEISNNTEIQEKLKDIITLHSPNSNLINL